MGKLENHIVIVTGAAQGMGEHTAALFSSEGAQVIVADLNIDLGTQTAERIGGKTLFQQLDVANPDSWQQVVATIIERFGRIDGLVNNAAIEFSNLIEETDIGAMRKLLDIDLLGPWLGMRTVVPHMKAARRGSIVNISSSAGIAGACGHTSYSAAKWGVRGITKSLAKEVGPFGVRANCVLPGSINTPMFQSGFAKLPDGSKYESVFPDVALNRVGQPSEIALASLFLISDDSSYVSGTDIAVDGGWTCGYYTINKPQVS